jgi:hypothetical protein
MSNSKLEDLKKGLENISVEKFQDEEKETNLEKIDSNSLWLDDDFKIDLSAFAANITSAASYGNYHHSSGSYTFSTGPSVFSNSGSHTFEVKGDANFEGDIKWKGKSLDQLVKGIEDRLAILIPDPEKLEHFEALKKAYEHYKTLEALCSLPKKEEK